MSSSNRRERDGARIQRIGAILADDRDHLETGRASMKLSSRYRPGESVTHRGRRSQVPVGVVVPDRHSTCRNGKYVKDRAAIALVVAICSRRTRCWKCWSITVSPASYAPVPIWCRYRGWCPRQPTNALPASSVLRIVDASPAVAIVGEAGCG